MFTEMYPRMVRYASQLMGDGEEARDIVSEVMEQAWKHFDQLDEADRGGWIYTAVRNTCLNRMKHLQVERDNAKALYEATLADVKSNYREHEALLQKAETIARSLPEPTCTILQLCYYEHLTYREVAQQLGISPDAFDRAGKMHRSVFADVVVIACSVETTAAVHQVQSLRRKRTIPLRGGTMHHDQIDNSHVNK